MKLWLVSCICLAVSLGASQYVPYNVALNQTVPAGASGSTIVGPIFIGTNGTNGIVTGSGSTLNYWKRNSGAYSSAQSWTPVPSASYLMLAQEYIPGNKFAAQVNGAQSTKLNQLSGATFGVPPGDLLYPDGFTYTVKSVGFSKNGAKFVTGNSDGSINVWGRNTNNDTYTPREKLLNHSSAVIDVALGIKFLLVTLSDNGEVIAWKHNDIIDKYELINYIVIPGATKVAACNQFESLFVVGMNDGTIAQYYWNLVSGYDLLGYATLGSVTGHAGPVQSIELSDSCMHMFSASNNMIHWATGAPPTLGYYTAVQQFSDFNPLTLHVSPSELAVAEEGTGNFRVYNLTVNCSASNFTNIDPYTCNCSSQNNTFWNGEMCYRFFCEYYPFTLSNKSPTECNCKPYFYWNSTLSFCFVNCSLVPFNNGTNDQFNCFCQPGYDWFNSSCVRRVNCSNDPLSTGKNLNTITCECTNPAFVQWNNVTQFCTVDCTKVDYTNATVNSTVNASTCKCINYFFWNVTNTACYPNCTTVPYSNGSNFMINATSSPSECVCNLPTYWIGSGCGIDCTTIDNALIYPANGLTCNCSVGYAWNATAVGCWRNCSDIAYAAGNLNASACQCAYGYEWNNTSCVLSIIDCSAVQNATSQNQTYNCNCIANFYYFNRTCKINCLAYEFSNGVAASDFSCSCETGFVWDAINNICNIDCNSRFNTTGSPATGARVCSCINGYTWSTSSLVCVVNCSALANAFAIDYSYTACGCLPTWMWSGSSCVINCALIPFAATTFNNTVCTCQSGFVWKNGQCVIDCSVVSNANTAAPWGVYSCSCLSGYYWGAGYCQPVISCAGISFATGVDQSTNISCLCAPGYFWQYGACWLNCAAFTGVTGLNNGIGACSCLAGLFWNGFGCSSLPTCSGMAGSLNIPSPFNPSICLCQANYFWTGTGCVLFCAGVLNSNGTSTASSCLCNNGYSWNGVTNVCQFNCNTVSNVNSTASASSPAGTCVCNTDYFWSNGQCWFNCSKFNNATQTNSLTSCSCLTNYYWANTSVGCLPNCNAMGGVAINSNLGPSCSCQTGYYWADGYCWIDCSQVLYSNGSNNGVSACDCQNGYYWDWTLGACDFDCTGVANSDSSNADPNPYTCNCNSGFYWNTTSFKCLLNCSQITNTTSTINENTCSCSSNSAWNPTTLTCVYSPPAGGIVVNCANYNHTNGSNGSACLCIDGYWWNTTDSSCYLNCSAFNNTVGNNGTQECMPKPGYIWNGKASAAFRDCSLVANATTFDPNNPNYCLCKQGWTYNTNANTCDFNCANINYTTSSTPNSDGSCQCASNYHWDSTIHQCVSKSSNSHLGVGLGVGLGVPGGLLLLAGLGFLAWSMCPAAAPMAPMALIPVAAPAATTTTLVTMKTIPTATTIAAPMSRAVIGAPVQQIVRSPGIVSNVRVGSPVSNVIQMPLQSNVVRGISPINVGPTLAGPQMIAPQQGMTFGGQNIMRGPGIQSVVRRI